MMRGAQSPIVEVYEADGMFFDTTILRESIRCKIKAKYGGFLEFPIRTADPLHVTESFALVVFPMLRTYSGSTRSVEYRGIVNFNCNTHNNFCSLS